MTFRRACAGTSRCPGSTRTTRSSGTPRRPLTNYRDGSVAFEQLEVEFPVVWSLNATNIVAQKYFRGTLGTPERESSLRQVIDRVVDTITAVGRRAAATSSTTPRPRRSATSSSTSSSPSGPRSTGRCGSTSACRACRSRRARASSSPSTTRWTRSSTGTARRAIDLQGRLGRRASTCRSIRSSQGAPEGRRHGVRPGQLHARRRRVGRHDQVGRQDPARRQDGHPRRRPPRHRGVHLVQGDRGAQGARAARRRLRHGPRRRRLLLDPVPERQQLGAGHRRVHAGRASTTPTGTSRAVTTGEVRRDRPRPRPVAPDRRGGVGVRRPRPAVRHHDQPLAHRRRTPAASTARNPCSEYMHLDNSACNLARSTCSSSSTTTARSTSTGFKHAVEVVFTAQEILVGNADYPTETIAETTPALPPARPRLRQPRRAADGARACRTTPTRAGRGRRPSPRS